MNNTSHSQCALCPSTLRSGELKICRPCLDSTLEHCNAQKPNGSQSQCSTPTPRPPAPKIAAARAAAQSVVEKLVSTGTHVNTLHQKKADRDLFRSQASSKRMYEHPAAPKPAPFSTPAGRACSVGWMVQYHNKHHTHSLVRGIVNVNRNLRSILAPTKKAIFDLWDHTPLSDHKYPQPPLDYDPQWFSLAKPGKGKMPPCILHDDEVLGNHLDTTKGEPALELIFLAEKYYSAHPNIPRLLTPVTTTTTKTKRGKRKASEELTLSDQELDEYFSSDNSLGTARYSLSKTTRKKTKSTPSTST